MATMDSNHPKRTRREGEAETWAGGLFLFGGSKRCSGNGFFVQKGMFFVQNRVFWVQNRVVSSTKWAFFWYKKGFSSAKRDFLYKKGGSLVHKGFFLYKTGGSTTRGVV